MIPRRITTSCLALLIVFLAQAARLDAQSDSERGAANLSDAEAQWRVMVDRSVEYLRLRGQAKDGSFSSATGIGPTGLVVTGLLAVGVPTSDPMVTKALAFLEKHVQPNGGIYAPDSLHQNYDTCIAMVAFAEVAKTTKDGRYDSIVSGADAFVRGIQRDEDEGLERSDMDYGGAGYGKHRRPDLSNTSFLVDALHELGNGPEDEAMQKALEFVSRCQNLESPYNNSPHAAKINDGGFYYTVAAGGESKAGTEPNGGLRSYGSMTYAGLKSMIYAGVSNDDPRVKAAVEFLRKNYDLESNPGMGQEGLFYYYHTMAKALDAFGEQDFDDSQGVSHDWKAELRNKLASLQLPDGSWVNPTTRWLEGDPNLVSGYALLSLSYCKP